jgi:hypothetical protein
MFSRMLFRAIPGILTAGVAGFVATGCFETAQTESPKENPVSARIGEKVFAANPEVQGSLSKQGPDGAIFPEKSVLETKNGSIVKDFEFQVPESGEYFLGAWIDGLQGQSFGILLDGFDVPYRFIKLSRDGWQAATAAGGRLSLVKGVHLISVTLYGQDVPNVETLVLGAQEAQVRLPESPYLDFVAKLKAEARPSPKTKGPLAKDAAVQDDPLVTYGYSLGANVPYTYWTYISLNSGTTVTFQTNGQSSNCDPVIHLFHETNASLTWSNDDGAGYPNSKLTVAIPQTGWYIFLLHSYSSSTAGTVNVTKNGSAWVSAAAASGNPINIGTTGATGTLNYFTGYPSSGVDTRIWVMQYQAGNVLAYNDDYPGTGNFSWGYCSRVKGSFGGASNILVSAYSSSNPSGTADVYGHIPNVDPFYAYQYQFQFPSLNMDDAMQTGPATSVYNCFSWAGGVTSDYWIPFVSTSQYLNKVNPWFDASSEKTSFDNFFANRCKGSNVVGSCPRYAGAWNYTPTTLSSEALIDLYFNGGHYTHASVAKPGNGHPHGFDSESKIGDQIRMFHPRKALEMEQEYGTVQAYYKRNPTFPKVAAAKPLAGGIDSDRESERLGLTIIPSRETFNAGQLAKLDRWRDHVTGGSAPQFESAFEAMKKKWLEPRIAMQSIPGPYRTDEYKKILGLCRENTDGCARFLFSKLGTENGPFLFLLEEALGDRFQGDLQAKVDDWIGNHTSPDGKVIAYSTINVWTKVAKAYLDGRN